MKPRHPRRRVNCGRRAADPCRASRDASTPVVRWNRLWLIGHIVLLVVLSSGVPLALFLSYDAAALGLDGPMRGVVWASYKAVAAVTAAASLIPAAVAAGIALMHAANLPRKTIGLGFIPWAVLLFEVTVAFSWEIVT